MGLLTRLARHVAPAAAVILLSAPAAMAQGSVPVEVQAAVIKKVFTYAESLREPLRVLVVHSGDEPEVAESLASAFDALDVRADVLDVEAAIEELESASAAYLLDGSATDEIRSVSVEQRILTMAGDVDLAESGRVALAVGLTDDGKPEIVVHLPRLEREGHALPARLLSLARVIR